MHSQKTRENHAHAIALLFLYYNFVRIHKTLKVTPAMAAGVTNRLGKWATLSACWRLGKPATELFLIDGSGGIRLSRIAEHLSQFRTGRLEIANEGGILHQRVCDHGGCHFASANVARKMFAKHDPIQAVFPIMFMQFQALLRDHL